MEAEVVMAMEDMEAVMEAEAVMVTEDMEVVMEAEAVMAEDMEAAMALHDNTLP